MVYMYIWAQYLCLGPRDWRTPDALELTLWMAASNHMGARKRTQVPSKSSKCS